MSGWDDDRNLEDTLLQALRVGRSLERDLADAHAEVRRLRDVDTVREQHLCEIVNLQADLAAARAGVARLRELVRIVLATPEFVSAYPILAAALRAALEGER